MTPLSALLATPLLATPVLASATPVAATSSNPFHAPEPRTTAPATLQLDLAPGRLHPDTPQQLIAGQTTQLTTSAECKGVGRQTACLGTLTYAFSRDDVRIVGIEGGPGLACQIDPARLSASCRVDVAAGTAVPLRMAVHPDPSARGGAPMHIHAEGNFRVKPERFDFIVKGQGQVFVRQSPDPAVAISGARFQPLSAWLYLETDGPSDALDVIVDETIPFGFGIKLLGDSASHCQVNGRALHCAFESIRVGRPTAVQFQLSAHDAVPDAVAPLSARFDSDLGAGAVAFSAIAVGSHDVTHQRLEPSPTVTVGQPVIDHLESIDLRPSLASPLQPTASPWYNWHVTFDPALQIDSVKQLTDWTMCSIARQSNQVYCSMMVKSPLTSPNADITLHASQPGHYSAELVWDAAGYGEGRSSSVIEVVAAAADKPDDPGAVATHAARTASATP